MPPPIEEYRTLVKEWSDDKLINERSKMLGLNEHIYAIDAELARRPQAAVSEQVLLLTAEVEKLTASSTHLETLTDRLKWLTWVLVVLAALGTITPFAVELWKANHPEVHNVRVVELPPQSGPKTPVPQPH